MPSSQECKAFIKEIAPYAQKAYGVLGKVRPSVCIAMACVESAYGTKPIMRKHNAFLGFKVGSGKTATKYWSGTYFNAKTSEEYVIGQHTPIKADFRSYESMEQCVFNFYELLNAGLYAYVEPGVDYKTQMQQIKKVGYMTSSTEVDTVLSIITKQDLTKYDNEVGIITIPTGKNPTLKIGSRGKYVTLAQTLLDKKGYHLEIDGIFGVETQKITSQFQRDNHIMADGIIGKQTWGKLYQ